MIRLAFRFDDPSATSDHELERGVICALQDHGMRATFGVIPFRSSDGRLVALNRASSAHLIAAADAGTIEIALHGHSHVSRVSSRQPNSEFDGVPAAEQLALLQEASAHLQSLCGPLPA